MRYLLSVFLLICTFSCIQAQDYTQRGTTFIQTSSKNSSSKATKTEYTWEKNDVKYPIYISSKGKAYIVKTSKKTGKEYKQYLPDTVAETIKKGRKI